MKFSLISLATALTMACSALATYYPPFLTPVGTENWVPGTVQSFSWNNTLPEGVTDYATSAQGRLGFLVDETFVYAQWGLYKPDAHTTLIPNVEFYGGGNNTIDFYIVAGIPVGSKVVVSWYGNNTVHSGEVTLVSA